MTIFRRMRRVAKKPISAAINDLRAKQDELDRRVSLLERRRHVMQRTTR